MLGGYAACACRPPASVVVGLAVLGGRAVALLAGHGQSGSRICNVGVVWSCRTCRTGIERRRANTEARVCAADQVLARQTARALEAIAHEHGVHAADRHATVDDGARQRRIVALDDEV